MTTTDKLNKTRAHIKRWERKLSLAATKLGAYRRQETRLVKQQAKDNAAIASGTGERAFRFDEPTKETPAK